MAARLRVAESTCIGSRDAPSPTEVVPLFKGSGAMCRRRQRSLSAAFCVARASGRFCVFCVSLVLPRPDRVACAEHTKAVTAAAGKNDAANAAEAARMTA